MKKIWLSAIASAAFVFMSCASSGPHVDAFNRAQKAYNDGKDDKAIAEALEALKIKPDYKPAIEFLNKTFDDVIAAKNATTRTPSAGTRSCLWKSRRPITRSS